MFVRLIALKLMDNMCIKERKNERVDGKGCEGSVCNHVAMNIMWIRTAIDLESRAGLSLRDVLEARFTALDLLFSMFDDSLCLCLCICKFILQVLVVL